MGPDLKRKLTASMMEHARNRGRHHPVQYKRGLVTDPSRVVEDVFTIIAVVIFLLIVTHR